MTISGGGNFTVFTVNGSATATLSGLTITDGNAFGSGRAGGGGVENSGTLTVSNSTLSDDSAYGGGGIFNDNNGTLTVSNSTLSDDSAYGGGGIYNQGTLTVSNSTLTDNSGGAVFNDGTLTASNSTIVGNSASSVSGGITDVLNSSTATLNGDIVVGNGGGDIFGTVASSSSYNLIGSGADSLAGTNDNQVSVTLGALQLAPLGYYGGPTQTLALLPGSVAIGSGSVGVTTDQRGFTTSGDTSIDAGAFQFQSSLVVNSTDDTAGADSPGLLTLRQAVNLADADTTTMAQPITFDPTVFDSSQTITLTNGTLTLGASKSANVAPITITGPSAGVTISGADSFTVFTVNGNTTATLSGLTITDGFTAGNGGGIVNSGTLTVSASTLSGNSASGDVGGVGNGSNGGNGGNGGNGVGGSGGNGEGGGIYNGGTLTVTASTLSGNSASGGEGGEGIGGSGGESNGDSGGTGGAAWAASAATARAAAFTTRAR